MRLINTSTFKLIQVDDSDARYAILSHTWGEDEVTFPDPVCRQNPTARKPGVRKSITPAPRQNDEAWNGLGSTPAAIYRPTTDDNALRKWWHMPLKTAGVTEYHL
jgi:hypothetical protein